MESFNQNVIKHKAGLLNLAAELGNISKACKMMGFSPDTFYRYQAARDAGGVEALFEVSRRKPNLKNRVEEAIEVAVTAFAIDFPAYGQTRASNELRKQGVFVSPSGVRSIWMRHDLASMKQRLRALEKLSYVGTIKGVGRIYQQTFGDTYSNWAAAKLHTTKAPITGADLLNDRVLPFFSSMNMGLIRLLTDRGPEYCGRVEAHDYELYLGVNGIENTKTKARHPQTNGICERFHKTILNEFYQVAFRRKLYQSLEELQAAGHMDRQLQHPKNPPGQNVLRKDSHADAY